MQCLVVDDDAEIRSSLMAYLLSFGWQVDAAADGQVMRQLLAQARPDVIVLDLMLPGEDGLALLRWLGTQADAPPVLMLTARSDTMSRVVGLELGADDYLAKPFEPRELVARLQALVRRSNKGASVQDDSRLLRFGRWRFDRLARQLISPDDVGVALSSARAASSVVTSSSS